MFTELDDVRSFALTLTNKLVSNGYLSISQDTQSIQDEIVDEVLDKLKQEDCLIPDGGEAYEITDYCDQHDVAFISIGGIPLGIFVIYSDTIEEDDDSINERLYVSINHTVVY